MPAPTTWATTQVSSWVAAAAPQQALPVALCLKSHVLVDSCTSPGRPCSLPSQPLRHRQPNNWAAPVLCNLQACGRPTARALRRMASLVRCTSGGELARMLAGCRSTRWADTGAQVGAVLSAGIASWLQGGGWTGHSCTQFSTAQHSTAQHSSGRLCPVCGTSCSPHIPARACPPAAVVDACWAADGGCLLTVSTDQTARITTRLHDGHWCEIARPQVCIRWQCWWCRPQAGPAHAHSRC